MEGGSIISECVTNTKTIFAYNFQPEAIRLYLEAIDYITQRQIRDNFINGLVIGLIYFGKYTKNAALYAATKRYVLNDSMETEDMAIIQMLVGNGYNGILSQLKNIGHIKKAIVAFKSVYSTLETESLIPPYLQDNINKLSPNNIQGKIEFRHVYFAYPKQIQFFFLIHTNYNL